MGLAGDGGRSTAPRRPPGRQVEARWHLFAFQAGPLAYRLKWRVLEPGRRLDKYGYCEAFFTENQNEGGVMSILSRFLVSAAGALAAFVGGQAAAQQLSDAARAHPGETAAMVATPEAAPPETAPATGPLIYISDENGNLATVDTHSHLLHIIGNSGLYLTDLAFYPTTHVLYGITFEALYKINTKTAAATLIADTSGTQLNALYVASNKVAYTEGPNVSELYKLNLKTGAETPVGPSNGYYSSGDIAYYNGKLVWTTTSNQLLTLNPSTGAAKAPISLPISNMFGLASTGTGLLYGFAGTSFYQIFPAAKSESARTKLLANFSTQGISEITGAAYDGNFGL